MKKYKTHLQKVKDIYKLPLELTQNLISEGVKVSTATEALKDFNDFCARTRAKLNTNSGLIISELLPDLYIKTYLKEHYKIIYIIHVKFNYIIFDNFTSLNNYLHYYFKDTISEPLFKYKTKAWHK
jgi:hypothetical protein